MQNSICQISVNSKKGTSKGKIYEQASTYNESNLLQLDSTHSVPSHYASQDQQSTFRKIQKKIQEVEQAQKLLIEKYERVKDNMLRQIQKKEQGNAILEKDIFELRLQLEDSRKDLGIISDYLKKKALGSSNKRYRKDILHSTKKVLDNSKVLSQNSIAGSSRDKVYEKKNRSPRLLKKF